MCKFGSLAINSPHQWLLWRYSIGLLVGNVHDVKVWLMMRAGNDEAWLEEKPFFATKQCFGCRETFCGDNLSTGYF